MLTTPNFEAHVARLVDPTATPEARRALATEVRDSIEVVHSAEYGAFLQHFFPAFRDVLTGLTKPQAVDNQVHKTRSVLLEILNRLPPNEVLRPRVRELLPLAMQVLREDNEENAVTAIHIIFDLHKTFRPTLEPAVQPFLDFVRQLYASFGDTVARAFPVPPATRQEPLGYIRPSTHSFKVITECPLIVMFLFQLYPSHMTQNIPQLLPLMVRAIEYEIPPERAAGVPKAAFQEFIAAQVKTVSFLSFLLKQFQDMMKPHEQSIPRSVVQLLKACPGDAVAIRKELLVATRHILATSFRVGFYGQIDLLLTESVLVGTGRAAYETLRPLAYSFLAELVHYVRFELSLDQLSRIIYLFSTNLHDRTLTYAVQTTSVRLLLNLIEGILKKEDSETRMRQLLVRIMNTIVTKYDAIAEQVPQLLQNAADMHNRSKALSAGDPLSKEPVGDPLKEINECKQLIKALTLGLKTVVWSAMNIRVSPPLPPSVPAAGATAAGPSGGLGAQPSAAVGALGDAGAAQPPGAGPPGAAAAPRLGLLEEECELLASLLGSTRQCLRLYNGPVIQELATGAGSAGGKTGAGSEAVRSLNPTAASTPEEKEILDSFAQIFTILDPRSFQDVFGLRMPELFEHIVDKPAALAIPQHFLTNTNISKYFADILLNFLVSRLSELGAELPDDLSAQTAVTMSHRGPRVTDKSAQGLLRLFRILFASVTLFPLNEPVLKPHLSTIVRGCLSYAAKCEDPGNYLQLLRALFKSLTNGKHEMQFEMLYRDFMPLVEPLFDGLLDLYNGPQRVAYKDLITELCLTVPARPSTIFPYLSKQLKPMVWALGGSRENILFGLRATEFWVETLQPAYLDGLLDKVEPELTLALQRHARPARAANGTSFGTLALRILGKLGKRSRRQTGDVAALRYRPTPDAALRLQLSWSSGSRLTVEVDNMVRLAAATLMDELPPGERPRSSSHKYQAWSFLRSCIVPLLGIQESAGGAAGASLWWDANDVASAVEPRLATSVSGSPDADSAFRTRAVYKAEIKTLKEILVALLLGPGALESDSKEKFPSAVAESREVEKLQGATASREFAMGLCRYFALLHAKDLGGCAKDRDIVAAGEQPKSTQALQPDVLDPNIFFDAVIEVMSRERRDHAEAGHQCLVEYLEALLRYGGVTRSSADTGTKHSAMVGDVTTEGAAGAGFDGKAVDHDTEMKVDDEAAENTGISSQEGGVKKSESTADAPPAHLVAALASLVQQLCHCCYQRSWHAKWAGGVGFAAVIARVPVGVFRVRTSQAYEVHVVRALMFIVRDLSNDVRIATTTAARRSLVALLELCHRDDSVRASGDWDVRALRDVTVCITVDLTSHSRGARDAAKEALKTLANTMKCTVADVVSLAKDPILRLLSQRSLRQLSFPVQIGYIDALTFCLELETPILAQELFSSPLNDTFLVGVVDISEDATIEKLTEAEDGIRHKLVENRLVQTTVLFQLIHLRRRSVDFLRCITFKCPQLLRAEGNDELFRRIISSFFKSIQSRDTEVVASAKQGLKQAISQHAKPKELLQTNLRPMLTILADYKKLTIPYLQGLSRVLELLSRWFSVQLGDKLLEHLERWTEPEALAAVKRWTPGTESLVGAAILDLFHMLPAQASKFLVPVVHMVLRLEAVLSVAGPGVAHLGLNGLESASTSPYREPLLKFCNTHAVEAVIFFLGHLGQPQIRRLFFVLLRANDAGPLCAEFASNPGRLINATFDSPNNEASNGMLAFNGVLIVDTLSRRDPSYLMSNPTVLQRMVTHWNSRSRIERLRLEDSLPLEQLREARIMSECFIRQCRQDAGNVDLLFHLLRVFSLRTLTDFTFVKDFLSIDVAKGYSTAHKRAIMDHFLTFFVDKSIPQERKVYALQFLIVPILSDRVCSSQSAAKHASGNDKDAQAEATSDAISSKGGVASLRNVLAAPSADFVARNAGECATAKSGGPAVAVQEDPHANFETAGVPTTGALADVIGSSNTQDGKRSSKDDDILDDRILSRIMKDLLDQPDEVLRQYDEPLSSELLQLATLLVQHMPAELGRYRKELIKFGWNHLKRDDSVAKQWAFVNVSRFFEAYQAPDKIILQVYVALLRYCQPEGRELVRRALDILTPALPKRLLHNVVDHKYPIWIRYTKKILLEEGHSLPHLVHIWQLIVRHSDLFYVARAQFVPIMVNSLARIGLQPNAAVDNRRLALDLADLIISWEGKRVQKAAELSRSKAPSVGTKRSRGDHGLAVSTGGVPPQPAVASAFAGSDGTCNGEEIAEARPYKLQKNMDGAAVSPPGPGTGIAATPDGAPAPADADDFRPAPSMVDMVVNFLAQVAFRQMDRREGRVITKRCVDLISAALRLWPDSLVRLSFLEKFLDQGAVERASAQAAAAAAAASAANRAKTAGAGGPAGAAAAAAAAKDAAKAEKADAQATERAAARANALVVALELSLVLIDHQGVRFVSSNVGAIRAMVSPAIADRNVPVATLFAKLLSKLIPLCNLPPDAKTPLAVAASKSPGIAAVHVVGGRQNSGTTSVMTPGGAASVLQATGAAATGISAIQQRKAAVAGAGATGVPVSPVGRQQAPSAGAAAAARPTARSPIDNVYALVEAAVERCLKGNMADIHCALIILQALVENRPGQFSRFQEVAVKALHRMAKESLTMSQPTVSGSTATSANQGQKDKQGAQAGATSSANGSAGGRSGQGGAVDSNSGNASAAFGRGGDSQTDEHALILGLSLLGSHITSLEPGQKRIFFQILWTLIDRCVQVKVLLEIVRIIGTWVRWRAPRKDSKLPKDSVFAKEPLSPKEKVSVLLKMTVFERITGQGSQALMAAYLNIVLSVFGGGADPAERRPELLQKLERAFMIGLKTESASIRSKFFALFDAAADRSPFARLRYVIAKQDWEPLADSYWIPQALELLLAVVNTGEIIRSDDTTATLPLLKSSVEVGAVVASIDVAVGGAAPKLEDVAMTAAPETKVSDLSSAPTRGAGDPVLSQFVTTVLALRTGDVLFSLRELMHLDAEVAASAWVAVFPRAWSLVPESERPSMEASLSALFTKEYHGVQVRWAQSVVPALLEGASRCVPLPPIRPDILLHVGSRWNAWHTALPYLDRRDAALRKKLQDAPPGGDARVSAKVEGELELVLDATGELYRRLNELDMFAGVWKGRCEAQATTLSLCLEQQARYVDAQAQYSELNMRYAGDVSSSRFASRSVGRRSTASSVVTAVPERIPVGKAEICLWESRWIECARELCQWEVLTEFSRSCVHSELLHDCLWRVPEWSAMKEVLLKHPVEEGSRLKMYEAYIRLQENKLEMADSFIQQGMQRALEEYCLMPLDSGHLATAPSLVQFQQFVELQESSRILSELTALSRQGAQNVNVEQKIESLKTTLNAWRERLPAPHESLRVWSDILSWRNHVHSSVVNVLESLKNSANQTLQAAQNQASIAGLPKVNSGPGGQPGQVDQAQAAAAAAIVAALTHQQALVMGVNETAWSVHRFARACRKQGLPGVALSALQQMYPFNTMELTEYFVKTKETAKSYMAHPPGLENGYLYGLNELSRCNMDHFSAHQKAHLFTMKGQFLKELSRNEDAAEAFSTALSTASDVSAAWLAWAEHSDDMHMRTAKLSDNNAMTNADESSSHAALAWREAAANCYLQSVRFGSGKGRMFISRALRLLTLDIEARQRAKSSQVTTAATAAPTASDADSAGTSKDVRETSGSPPQPVSDDVAGKGDGVQSVFTAFVDILPPWIWLPWIPQLVPMLGRAEGFVARAILVRVAQLFPQALFFPLRAYLEDGKDEPRATMKLVAEALRNSRPNTAPLLPAAATAQLTTATKQMNTAHANAQQAKQRMIACQAAHKKLMDVVLLKVGTPEHAELVSRASKLKEDWNVAQNAFDRALKTYQTAAQQKKSAAASVEQIRDSAAQSLATPEAAAGSAAGTGTTTGAAPVQPSHGRSGGVLSSAADVSPSSASVSGLPSVSAAADGQSRASNQNQALNPSTTQAAVSAVANASSANDASMESCSQPQTPSPAQVAVEAQAQVAAYAQPASFTPKTRYEHADIVMARLAKAHQGLYGDMDRIASDLAYRMKPYQEEQLLGLVNALLHRCYQLSVQPSKEVAPSLRSALEEVSRMCFGTTSPSEPASAASLPSKIHSSIADLKPSFEAELAPQTAIDFPTKLEPFIVRLRRWKNVFQRRVDAMPATLGLEILSRNLIEVQMSEVEVFGQYMVAEAAESNPSLHVKIDRFCADARVTRRLSGPARGVTILGDDGRKYCFVLETSVNSSAMPTEERAAQLCRLLNASLFARDTEASRRRLKVDAPILIATGSCTRLVSDDPAFSSLAEGLERYQESVGGNIDDAVIAFRNLSAEAYNRRFAQNPRQAAGRQESIAARVEAYNSVCESHVPDTCLSNWIACSIPSQNMHFAFRKTFAESLGTSAIVSFALAIGARRPQNLLFSWDTGAVSNSHMRPLVSARGLLECDEAVPFRLTRNIMRLIGPNGVHGPLFGAMAVSLRALRSNDKLLKTYLEIIVRDELHSWATARSDEASLSSRALAEKEFDALEDRLEQSVQGILSRLTAARLAPSASDCDNFRNAKPGDGSSMTPLGADLDEITYAVYSLIDRAGRPEHLAQMEASWHAWF
jgi:phosphatidylinositol kinase/protein kinase (PI-3  family)